MLNATVTSERNNAQTWVSWHLGESLPQAGYVCTRLEANGDELKIIDAHFQNIPLAASEKVIWTGDLADFIFQNLPVKEYMKWRKELTQAAQVLKSSQASNL